MTTVLDFNDAPLREPVGLEPDREMLATYLEVAFGYLEGLFPFRGFVDNGSGYDGKPYNEWVDVEREDAVDVIHNMVGYCAGNGTAAYCIPGTVAERGQAKAADVQQTQALVCDIDGGNIAEKLAHAAGHVGVPTLIVESGGRTEDGQDKLHVYWKLTEPAEGSDLEIARRLRHELAVKIGADTHFQSMHQPIRLPGSIYHKNQRTRLVTIRAHNELEYELSDLAERLGEMPALTSQGGSELDFNTAGRAVRDADELEAMLEKTKDPGQWHDNMRDVVASLIGQSWTDAEIQGQCGSYCDGGEADPDLTVLIATARKKWNTPSPAMTPTGGAQEPIGDPFAKLPAPPLAHGILPPIIEAFADAESREKGTAFHGPAMAALAVCAAAIPDHICLRVKVHKQWQENARLWIALIGPPSAKKSPLLRAAMAPLKQVEKQNFAKRAEAMKTWEQEDKDSRGPEPTVHRHVLNDSTVEAAAKILAENWHGLLLERDELSGWFGSLDKYNAGKGAAADRGFWLQAWNGGPYSVDRVTRGRTLYVPNLSVSILGGIQPDAIRRVIVDAVDDGLIQRLIPVHLEPAVVGEDRADDNHAYPDYSALVERLTKLPEIGAAPGGNPFDFNTAAAAPGAHRHAIFDGEAQEIRRGFERYTNDLTRLEAISPQFAAFAGKLDGMFARLALTFHCCESIDLRATQEATRVPERITEDTAKRVVRLMREFIIPHALHFYLEIADESTAISNARSIAGYILAKKIERITFSDLTSNCRPCRKKSRERVIEMIEPLEMFGWLQREGPPLLPKAWIVDQRVHEMFSERAEEERERREQVRSLLIETARRED